MIMAMEFTDIHGMEFYVSLWYSPTFIGIIFYQWVALAETLCSSGSKERIVYPNVKRSLEYSSDWLLFSSQCDVYSLGKPLG